MIDKLPRITYRRAVLVLAGVVAMAGGSCRQSGAPVRSALLAVPSPDLSGMESHAQQQVRSQYSSLTEAIGNAGRPNDELSTAFGEMGKLFMAAEYNDSAERCFLNAIALVPGDARWPYFLAQLYKRTGNLARSAEYFKRSIDAQPGNFVALWWLGTVEVERGRADDAEAAFTRALALQPDNWQTLYGLGRTALFRKDYTKAAAHLERVLEISPQASAAHYQLGLAYRGLGRLSEAEGHLRQRSTEDVLPADPMMVELDNLLETSVAYHSRAVQAGRTGSWTKAVEYLRKEVELDPENPTGWLDLGVALYRSGSANEAFKPVQRALQLSPRFARAYYVAGMLLALRGRDREAIESLAAAVTYETSFAAAHLSLAQALQRAARPLEAHAHFQNVLRSVPTDSDARFGAAVTLIQLGRYREASAQLREGASDHPGETRFVHTLARLLAAAPDASVRDGRRAHTIADELIKADPTVDRAETLAMAFAEMGKFDEAAAWQRHTIAEVDGGGSADLARQLTANLRLYEQGKPCRTPFRAGDPIFYPRPMAGLDHR
jgi:tetratricopeptide (TPR) repeat protein